MSTTSHEITQDSTKTTPKLSLGQTEQILMYHFSSTHFGDPMMDSLWTSFLGWEPKIAHKYAAHKWHNYVTQKWQQNLENKYIT